MNENQLNLEFFHSTTWRNKAIILACLKGYVIKEDGKVLNPKNEIIKGYNRNHNGVSYKAFSIRFPAGIYGRRTSEVSFHRYQAFKNYGMNIFKKNIVVRHFDGNSLNNTYRNIKIGTQSDNQFDRTEEERLLHSIKAIQGKDNLIGEKISDIKKDRANGFTYDQLSYKYGVSKSGLSYHLGKNCKRSVKQDYLDNFSIN